MKSSNVYDWFFLTIWTLVITVVLIIFGLERIGISAEMSIRNQSLVNFTSPPISSYGPKSTIIEFSKQGQISDAGFPLMNLELVNPLPFTRVAVEGKIKRQVMHQGFYSGQGFESLYGSGDAHGVLKYIDPAGIKQKIYIWLAWPDYDHSQHTILYHIRTAVSDEIPIAYGIQMTDPVSVLRGQITNVRLEIDYPRNS